MKQKKVLILFAFLLSFGSAFSQRGYQNLKEYDFEPYHFGFILGYNKMGFSIKQNSKLIDTTQFLPVEYGGTNQKAKLKSVEPESSIGFTIGIVGNLRLAEHFDLRFIPALSFGDRDLEYVYALAPFALSAKNDTTKVDIHSTLLELPLNLKYKGNRINNARPYIMGGIKYAFDLSSDANKGTLSASDVKVKLKKSDLYGELGVGFDFYFDWFKMGVEAKMSYGLKEILVRDQSMYTTSIKRLNSKIFQLSFTFE